MGSPGCNCFWLSSRKARKSSQKLSPIDYRELVTVITIESKTKDTKSQKICHPERKSNRKIKSTFSANESALPLKNMCIPSSMKNEKRRNLTMT
jgi:hypothetical protein